MRKFMALALCLLLCTSLVLTGCDEDQSAGSKYETYEDAMAAGDHGAAYSILLGDENADPKELDKYLVVPVLVEGTETANGNTGNVKAEMVYDENGWLLSRTVTNLNGASTTFTYTYDEEGRLVKEEVYNKITTYVYDDNGDMVTMVEDYDWRVVTTTFTYNEAHKPVYEHVQAFENERPAEDNEYTYTYDDRGNLLSRRTTEGAGVIYEYDANGNVTLDYEINSDGETYNLHYNKYDEEGRLISRKYESGEGSGSEYTYAYDSAGTRYTLEYQDGTEYSAVYEHKFDEEGRVIEQSYSNAAGITRSQTYDKWGNIASIYWKNAEGWEQNYTFTHNEYGYRTSDTYSDNKNQSYEYTVTYKVYYYPEGAPDIFLFLEKLDDNDTIRLFI